MVCVFCSRAHAVTYKIKKYATQEKILFPAHFFTGYAKSGMKACKTQNPRGHGRPARVDTDSRLNRAHPFSSPRHSMPTRRHGMLRLRPGVLTLWHGAPTLWNSAPTLWHGMPTLRHGALTLRHGVPTLPLGTGKGPIDGDTREITMTRANAPTNS